MLTGIGKSVISFGNKSEAESVWREALRIALNIHGTPVALEALAGFVSLKAKHSDREHALELPYWQADFDRQQRIKYS